MKILCTYDGNTLHITQHDAQAIAQTFGSGTLEIQISKAQQQKRTTQGAYYWGVVLPAIQATLRELGYNMLLRDADNWVAQQLMHMDKQSIHTYLKSRFVECVRIDAAGNVVRYQPSTQTMSRKEFAEYINKVLHFAASTLQTYIP